MSPGSSDRRRTLALSALALSGCVRADLVACGNGTACPGGMVCDEAHMTCVTQEFIDACAGLSDGDSCQAEAFSGVCDRGVCIEDVLPVIKPFQPAVPLKGFATSTLEEDDPSLTGDLLELYWLSNGDIWISKRVALDQLWSTPVPVPEIMTSDTEYRPCVSADGLTLYFARRPPGGKADVYVTTRPTRTSAWAAPTLALLDLNRPGTDELPGWSSPDGLTLLVTTTTAAGDADLYIATRPALGLPFTSAPFTGLNSAADDGAGWATSDGRTILFESSRGGNTDLWEAVRHRDTWIVERRIELDTLAVEGTPWLSPDGTVVVFSTNRSGTDDLYIATRTQ